MSKNYLYTIITCLIIFTISLCAKDQILGWYDFDTAVAADNDSGGVNYASGTLFSITKDIELDGTPQVGTAQVGTPAVGQPGDNDYVPASEDYVPASEDYVAATGNGGTPTGAASIGVESKLKYWVGTDVDETDLVIYPNQKAAFRIIWSGYDQGSGLGESYIDNLAFKGVFCAPYAKRPTVDPANADAIVGISNPYKNPNTDRVQARIFTNLEDGTATVDVYKTTDLTNADAWTLLLDDQTLVTGAATILEDSATDAK